MKKTTAILLAACLLLALVGCEAPTETKYFLTETLMEYGEGQSQRTVNHYTEDWTTSGYSVYLNGELDSETTIELDEHGYALRATQTRSGVTTVQEYKNTYDENGRRTRSETWNDGTLAYATDYTYEDGHLASQRQVTATAGGDRIAEIRFTEDGKVLSQKNIDPEGNESGIDFTYNEDGNVILGVNYYMGDGKPCHTDTVTEYDDQGRQIKSTVTDYDSEENVTRSYYTLYTYDGSTEIAEVYQDEELSSRTVRTYDEAGNLISAETTSYPGEGVMRLTYTYQAVQVPVK